MPLDLKKLKCVELFAGIGGFRLAADKLGIKTIWANDIEDAAVEVYKSKFGEKEIAQGDINKFLQAVPKHDLLTAGFPCQPFSSAGKKKGISDPRGTLFEAIVKILKFRQPEYFVLENVKRLTEMDSGKHFATILDALTELDYIVEWRIVNTMYFGLPQNRPRVLITGRKKNSETPGAISKLINSAEKKELSSLGQGLFGKAWTILSDHGKSFPRWGIAYNGKFFGYNLSNFPESKTRVSLKEVLENRVPEKYIFTEDTLERIKFSDFIDRFVNGIHILYNQKGGARMGYTVFGVDGLAPTLTCTASRHYERYQVRSNLFRRLTSTEYARIQGFPDDHCSAVSEHKQYKLYGNAISPKMAYWGLEKLLTSRGIEI